MRRSIAWAGAFLILVGSIFLAFGIWYALMYGVSAEVSSWNLLFPEFAGDLLSLISLSSAAIVLGVIFLLMAYKFPKEERKQKIRKG